MVAANDETVLGADFLCCYCFARHVLLQHHVMALPRTTHSRCVSVSRSLSHLSTLGAILTLLWWLEQVVVAASGGLAKKPSDFNATFIKHILPKLDWKALALTAKQVLVLPTTTPATTELVLSSSHTARCDIVQMGVATLPDAIPAGADKDEAFLKSVHDLILDVNGPS